MPSVITGLETLALENVPSGRAWVAQLVKHPAFDFGSSHDLTVHEMSPTLSVWRLLGILKINKHKEENKISLPMFPKAS